MSLASPALQGDSLLTGQVAIPVLFRSSNTSAFSALWAPVCVVPLPGMVSLDLPPTFPAFHLAGLPGRSSLLALSKAAFHSHPTLVFFLSPPFFIITYQNFPLLIIFFVDVSTWRVCPMSFLLVISSRRTECCQPCLPWCPWHLTQLLSSAGTQQTFSKWANELDNNVLKVRNCAQSFLDPITCPAHWKYSADGASLDL